MMGLENGTYYGAMFIFYTGVCFVTSLMVAVIAVNAIFIKVDFVVLFFL